MICPDSFLFRDIDVKFYAIICLDFTFLSFFWRKNPLSFLYRFSCRHMDRKENEWKNLKSSQCMPWKPFKLKSQ